jgi:predicted transcriptional regulator
MAKPARSADTTVRVDRATSSAIARIARETGVARKEVVALAIERLRRQRILESANAGFAAMKRDAGVWREELDERGSWESTLANGLGDE